MNVVFFSSHAFLHLGWKTVRQMVVLAVDPFSSQSLWRHQLQQAPAIVLLVRFGFDPDWRMVVESWAVPKY